MKWLALLFSVAGLQAAEHWAWVAPVLPPLPSVRQESWCRSDLDRFVLAELERRGLSPQPEAERATLLRRVSLDLTGLPPTSAEREAFLADPSPDAYAKAVERLLASPHFGERWASVWLDLARYADTQGYEKDNLRTIWAYRDWVVQAFNDDLPFDRFTTEQLAGDLLPAPTPDQLTATAFHRQTLTNTEGGADAEEFRLKAVVDRVETTSTVWLGLTLGCARCHDHPTEPVTQRDYYRLLAFFNNTADANDRDDRPVLELLPIGERHLPPAETPRETTVPVLRELPASEARTTHVWNKGDWRQPGAAVEAGGPAFLPPLIAPRPTRLDLAHWLVAPENPLTARVMANRWWAQLFGRGLVETEADFGSTGARPTHPALLDWLATRYAGPLRWSTKGLLREIVLSTTYRQSSAAGANVFAADPDNRWLARGPRVRLSAEMVHDQALSAAGLLSPKMFGRPVMPPQPEGVWQVVYNVQRWIPSRGEDRYRRALYTFWRRTSPYPGLALLGTPARESCTARRLRSDSPAAALVTLNDPVYAEAAQALASRMEKEPEPVAYGWRLLLGTEPGERAKGALQALWETDHAAAAAALLNLDAVLMKE